MNTLHLEDQVSFNCYFDQTKAQMLHSSGTTIPLISHQVVSGLKPGELMKRKNDAWNNLNLQRNLASFFGSHTMAFRPSDTVLKNILSVYQHNTACSLLEDRIRLDETPALRFPVDCSLEVDRSDHTAPIFTKHPRTGEITRHLHPYATLPRFKLPSTDPGLLGIAAYILERDVDHRDPCPLDIVQQFQTAWCTNEFAEHSQFFYKQLPTPPSSPPHSPCDESPPSHKRKHAGDGQARPFKRTRIAETAPRHLTSKQAPRRVDHKRASGVGSPHAVTIEHTPYPAETTYLPSKRKRAVSQMQDCPVQLAPITKRPRKDPPAATIPKRTVYERSAKSKGRLTRT
ncbi:hypothetical protein CYLTODRAFT_456898 [Cylindrobasidium torrendii FP15055 ss-10]|uniref:Uncharacterized protein n=1 Tax=Cylindrobasidium torrendii FP15055 ss-10 TaxID=1314674 RepID=A0A0D7B5I5_9AGAR|nr:hypothetical protein CYLTODRAFT_456898 [Cylindrobasidium torrendii FP15055 ss-10]